MNDCQAVQSSSAGLLPPTCRGSFEVPVGAKVVQGLDVVRAISVGEPPKVPDRMLKVRLAADLPPAERPKIEVENPQGVAFRARLAKIKAQKRDAFTVCDVAMLSREPD